MAETLALRALGYVAGDEQLLTRFVALTGVGLDDLMSRAGGAALLGAVIDFLLGDEPTLIAFADRLHIPPETVVLARHKLPGATTTD